MNASALQRIRVPMIITDAQQDDNPIVFANAAFLSLTGYEERDVVGRNCRFLQGPGTSQETVAKIREALDGGHELFCEILNYRKDGTSFWNALFIAPVCDRGRVPKFFFATAAEKS